LGLHLNMAVFFYEIYSLNDEKYKQEALNIADNAFEDALQSIDSVNEVILSLLFIIIILFYISKIIKTVHLSCNCSRIIILFGSRNWKMNKILMKINNKKKINDNILFILIIIILLFYNE